MKPQIVLALFLSLLSVTETSALVVNADFQPFDGSYTYSGQAVVNDPGNNFWNAIDSFGGPSVSASNLLASDGATNSGISISISNLQGMAGGAYNLQQFAQGGTLAPNLLGDYFLSQYPNAFAPNLATYTIGGLTPGQTYQFVFFSVAGGSGVTNHQTFFTLENLTQYATGFGSPIFLPGVNYVDFIYVPLGSTVSGTFYKDPNLSIEGNWNGFQIAEIAAIPEPGTMAGASLAVGVLILQILKRRRLRARTA